jgi:hypothetical protein
MSREKYKLIMMYLDFIEDALSHISVSNGGLTFDDWMKTQGK